MNSHIPYDSPNQQSPFQSHSIPPPPTISALLKHAPIPTYPPTSRPTVSNGISPEELIRFLGYVYGTMDVVADYYRIYGGLEP